jgi:H/ACA ribonucleoprotein complex non-core subunit NAF1
MDGFKVLQNIPQDLLLIQEFICVPNPTPRPQQEDKIDSSDSETVSEDEIAADLIKGTNEDNSTLIIEKKVGLLPSYIIFHLLKLDI